MERCLVNAVWSVLAGLRRRGSGRARRGVQLLGLPRREESTHGGDDGMDCAQRRESMGPRLGVVVRRGKGREAAWC